MEEVRSVEAEFSSIDADNEAAGHRSCKKSKAILLRSARVATKLLKGTLLKELMSKSTKSMRYRCSSSKYSHVRSIAGDEKFLWKIYL